MNRLEIQAKLKSQLGAVRTHWQTLAMKHSCISITDKTTTAGLFGAVSKWVFGASLLLLTACNTMTGTPAVTAEVEQKWVLLPINNLSQTPQADVQALSLIETRLRARGVRQIGTYSLVRTVSLRNLLDPSKQFNEAVKWAVGSGYRYGITGTINEWSYRSGADREPVVGMNLKLLDLQSGEVLWQANGSRTGWGYTSLPGIGDALIANLLTGIKFDRAN